MSRSIFRNRRLTLILLSLPGVVLLYGLSAYHAAQQALIQMEAGRNHLMEARAVVGAVELEEFSEADLAAVDANLVEAAGSFEAAQRRLHYIQPLAPLVKLFRPSQWGDFQAAPHLAVIGAEVAYAGQDAIAGSAPLLDLIASTGSSDEPVPITALMLEATRALEAGKPHFDRALARLDSASVESGLINRAALSDEAARTVHELDRWLPRLRLALWATSNGSDVVNSLLGMDRPRTYLLLSQNNDELRPTGGWIGTYGLLTVSNGEIIALDYRSAKTLTAPAGPGPANIPPWWIQLEQPVWANFDANWVADFPTAAQQAEWFVEAGGNSPRPLDGVIAIDLTGMRYLLNTLDPIEVPGYDQVVTGENLREQTYALWRHGQEGAAHHRFLAALSQAALEQAQSASSAGLLSLAEGTYRALRERHMLLYFDDPALAGLTAGLHWDGGLRDDAGDYLMVVDTSLANKGQSSVQETLTYRAGIQPDGSLVSQITLEYRFPAEALALDPALASAGFGELGYWNLMRVYVPQSSSWVRTSGNLEATYFDQERDRRLFGNLVVVAPSGQTTLQYDYLVPQAVAFVGERQVYRLTIQKQPGSQAIPLSVFVILPPGAQLLASNPAPTATAQRGANLELSFQTTLTTDQVFEVIFR